MSNFFQAKKSLRIKWLYFYIVIALAFLLMPMIYNHFKKPTIIHVYVKENVMEKTEVPQAVKPLSDIDPNTIDADSLKSFGIPSNIAQAWVNFRRHIKSYDNPEQIKKIYGMNDSIFEMIEPHLIFENKIESRKKSESRRNQSFTQEFHESSEPSRSFHAVDFDPNRISYDSLVLTGLRPSTARIFIKFRNSGAKFYDVNDLKNIYNMDEDWLEAMKEHFHFPKKKEKSFVARTEKKWTPSPVNINSASQEELEQLPGIGPTYAGRILKFREALGGFHNKEQLSEVYGLPDSTYHAIEPFLQESGVEVDQIYINTAKIKELSSHPYISFRQAKVIIAYRNQHGYYRQISDLNKVRIFKEDWLQKMEPYLNFDIVEAVSGL